MWASIMPWLEERLQGAAKSDKNHVNYQKYHHEKRDQAYRRNDSGSHGNRDALTHSVYMAWWEPHEKP